MGKLSFKLFLLLILVLKAYIPAGNAYAAAPTLDYFASLIPQPVVNFYDGIRTTDFTFQGAFNDLPKSGSGLVNFLKTAGAFFLTLLKWAGSVFTWIFNGIANGLEYLITTP